jgi:hypothetical protein
MSNLTVNVYSKSPDLLGRLLSNFAHTPFYGEDGRVFASVEGWWYWYTTGSKHDHLMELHGFAAKKAGREYPHVREVTPALLREAYRRKLRDNPHIADMLKEFDGEFEHYYVFNGKKVPADRYLWTAKLWEELRDELRNELHNAR